MPTATMQRSVTANDKAEILGLIDSRYAGLGVRAAMELHSRDLTIWVSGDSAFSRGLVQWSGTAAGGENPAPFWIWETLCFEHGAEGWRIVHQQTSAPFSVDGAHDQVIAGTRLRVGWAHGVAASPPC
jgi:SnoaL-like protein